MLRDSKLEAPEPELSTMQDSCKHATASCHRSTASNNNHSTRASHQASSCVERESFSTQKHRHTRTHTHTHLHTQRPQRTGTMEDVTYQKVLFQEGSLPTSDRLCPHIARHRKPHEKSKRRPCPISNSIDAERIERLPINRLWNLLLPLDFLLRHPELLHSGLQTHWIGFKSFVAALTAVHRTAHSRTGDVLKIHANPCHLGSHQYLRHNCGNG